MLSPGETQDALDRIILQAELMRRRILRADGLMNLEREQLLNGIADVLHETRRIKDAGVSEPLQSASQAQITR